MHDILVEQIKQEVTKHGVQELRTPQEVDSLLTQTKGTALIFVNSVCGCAGGVARPALIHAMKHTIKPDVIATVFASTDRDATMRAREYFTGMPPSSPSFALLKDGRLLHMIHRSEIEISDPSEVAKMLTDAFEKYCQAPAIEIHSN
ncbi:MAG: BrxA/BrxB family bacilliredoxin [Bacteroidetes bacterium]|nr:MAG: BrxA/BrxB family bacilliredoxin [Bacteroidota bacterium]